MMKAEICGKCRDALESNEDNVPIQTQVKLYG